MFNFHQPILFDFDRLLHSKAKQKHQNRSRNQNKNKIFNSFEIIKRKNN